MHGNCLLMYLYYDNFKIKHIIYRKLDFSHYSNYNVTELIELCVCVCVCVCVICQGTYDHMYLCTCVSK